MDPSSYHFTIYSLITVVAAMISFFLAFYAWNKRNVVGASYLAYVEFGIAVWALAMIFETAATTAELKFFWTKVSYLGNATVPYLFLLFAIAFGQHYQWLTLRRIILLAIVPLLTLAVAYTNELHHLQWTGMVIDPQTNIAEYLHGTYFWFFLGYSYLCLLAGIFIIYQTLFRFPGVYSRKIGLIVLATLLPFFGNLMYVFNLTPLPGLDWTLIGFVFSGMLMTYAVLVEKIYSIVPIASNLVIEQMMDGLLVLDEKGQLVDINPAASRYLGVGKFEPGMPVSEVFKEVPAEVVEKITREDIKTQFTLSMPHPVILDARSTKIELKNQRVGTLIMLRDITLLREMAEQLRTVNVRLEQTVNERTSQLNTTIDQLRDEVSRREASERELQTLHDSLADRMAELSRQITTVFDFILASGNASDLPSVMDRLLEHILRNFHGAAGFIYQMTENKQAYSLVVSRNISDQACAEMQTLPSDLFENDGLAYLSIDTGHDEKLIKPLVIPGFSSMILAPIHLRDEISGALGVYWTETNMLPVEEIALFSAMADQLGIVVENVRLRQSMEKAAVVQERRRLARELHDSVTQSLHSLVLTADTARNRMKQGKFDRLEESLDVMTEGARQALKDMRLLLYELRLVKLEELHLRSALEARIDAVERRAGVNVELDISDVIQWPAGWEGEVYAIIMEAMNNSLKHAQASRLSIHIHEDLKKVKIIVEDNGVGFDAALINQGGLGLKGMAERVERMNGMIDVSSKIGVGTRVIVDLDLENSQIEALI